MRPRERQRETGRVKECKIMRSGCDLNGDEAASAGDIAIQERVITLALYNSNGLSVVYHKE